MENRRRIGLMGGTFNPIHIGHLLLAETAYSQEKLNEIIFMPSGCSYLKSAEQVLDAERRLHMVRLATADNPHFSVSDMEIRRGGNTYTSETLQELCKVNPMDDYFFIVGADCLFSIENWHNPKEIFDHCTLVAAVREGASIKAMEAKVAELKKRFGADIHLLSFREIAISSTEIRAMAAKGESVRYMVPETVRTYMEEMHFYE